MGADLYKHPLIFIVDDDEDDVFFIRCALMNVIPDCVIKSFVNGKMLLDELELIDNVMPAFVIMDLNMPVLNGKETLRQMRSGSVGSAVPVAILTTSNNPKEKELCERLGANHFFSKPSIMSVYDEMIESLRKTYIDKVFA